MPTPTKPVPVMPGTRRFIMLCLPQLIRERKFRGELSPLESMAGRWYMGHDDKCRTPRAESQRALRDGSLAAQERERTNPDRRVVSITSLRVRPIDPDNLCGKYFVDALRYAGILSDDRAQDVVFSITQEKVSHKAEEKTIINVK